MTKAFGDANLPGKLLLVDGNSVLYRAFYGLPLLSTSKGLYTNAVYGFSMMLLNLLKEERPTHIAVAFDKGKATFRHVEFTEYKGKRQETPSELVGQFSMAREILTYFGIKSLELDRFEADDIIGTLARIGSEEAFQVVVVSGDKDLLQLVSDRVTARLTKKGTTDLATYDPAAVFERYTLAPHQIIDLKGLMGDTSDNIPGVPGVGEKTAIKLLSQFGSVEEVLAHADEVSGKKLQEKLQDYKEQALLSKRLATIFCEVPLSVSVEDLRYAGYDVDALKSVFREYEFRSLADRLQPFQGNGKKSETSEQGSAEFAADGEGNNDGIIKDVDFAHSLSEPISAEEVVDRLAKIRGMASMLPDIEGGYQGGTWKGLVIADALGAFYVPKSQDAAIVKAINDFLQNASITKVVYDYKALFVCLVASGFAEKSAEISQSVFDTLLATYLIHASEGEPSLIDVLERAMPGESMPEAVRASVLKPAGDRKQALAYCAKLLVGAHSVLADELRQQNLIGLYEDAELPLALVLADMELYGVRLDTDRLGAIGEELTAGIARLTSEIYDLAGMTFNINSTKQLGEILFEKMGLPPVKKIKTGYSTSADVLEKLAPHSDMVAKILEYRQLAKLQSTYIEGLLRVVRMPASRVHTSFHQAKTATGRLSSEDPNLQNIPIRMEEGRRLRQAFVPTHTGWKILSADYSQVELRILAHLSEDTALIQAFREDMDIHTRTASDVFEVPPEQVTSLMRRQAKAVNFGIIYGISDYGLSQNLNISRAQAAAFIEQYFVKFPGVKRYMEQSVARAREMGYAETVLGRRRYLPHISSRNFNERSFAERTAMNTPIQGTAADIIKLAMVNIAKHLRSRTWQSEMLLQVHDELIFECPEMELVPLVELVREAMEHAVELVVPLKVDVNVGNTWYDAK